MTNGNGELPINMKRLDDVTGGDSEFAIELVELFLSDSQATCGRLTNAAGNGDPEPVRREAHKLKGSAMNLGADRLGELARVLESAATAGQTELFTEQLIAIQREKSVVDAFLRDYLKQLQA